MGLGALLGRDRAAGRRAACRPPGRRQLALLHLPRTDFVVLSLNDICGYLLAGASFLALAGTLKAGEHIRVTMVLQALGEGARRPAEICAFGIALAGCGLLSWQLGRFAWVSFLFNEVSPGMCGCRCAIRSADGAGRRLLAVALADELVIIARGGRPTFRQAEDAITLGKEG